MGKPCVTDEGYIDAATKAAEVIWQNGITDIAITAALALAQKNARTTVADMQAEIADRQMALAEAAHAQAAAFWGEETDFVNDAFGQGLAAPERVPLAIGWGQYAYDANANARAAWVKASRAMCMPPTRCDDARWSFQVAKNVVDTTNHALRQAESRADALNDRRYARQYAALGLGQGKLHSAKTYAAVAGLAAGSAGGMLVGTINSGLELMGYSRTRNNFQRWSGTTIPREYMPQQTGVARSVTVNSGLRENTDDVLGDFIVNNKLMDKGGFPAMVVEELPPLDNRGTRGGA